MQVSFTRRIDELGRIVIPKEIRRSLRFNDGALLDLNIYDSKLVISKSNSSLNKDFINKLIDLVNIICKIEFIISEDEKIIFVNNQELKQPLLGKQLSEDLISLLREHKSEKSNRGLQITNDNYIKGDYTVKTIIRDSSALGLIIMRCDDVNYSDDILENILNLIVESF